MFVHPVHRAGGRPIDADHMDMDGAAQADNLIDDRGADNFPPSGFGRFAHHDAGDIMAYGKLDHCLGHRGRGDGRHLGPETFSQPQIMPDSFPIFLLLPAQARSFNVDGDPLRLQFIG